MILNLLRLANEHATAHLLVRQLQLPHRIQQDHAGRPRRRRRQRETLQVNQCLT